MTKSIHNPPASQSVRAYCKTGVQHKTGTQSQTTAQAYFSPKRNPYIFNRALSHPFKTNTQTNVSQHRHGYFRGGAFAAAVLKQRRHAEKPAKKKDCLTLPKNRAAQARTGLQPAKCPLVAIVGCKCVYVAPRCLQAWRGFWGLVLKNALPIFQQKQSLKMLIDNVLCNDCPVFAAIAPGSWHWLRLPYP